MEGVGEEVGVEGIRVERWGGRGRGEGWAGGGRGKVGVEG